MDCLNNFIGIQGCGAPSYPMQDADSNDLPFSGLFINQLPGVSLEVMESIADDEQQTYLGVWDDVQLRALKKFVLAAKAELNKCYRITDTSVVECLLCEAKDSFAVALWYFMGVELMIERTSSTRLNRFTTIDVDKAEKLKTEFYTEFQAALSDAVTSINPCDTDCMDCAEPNADVRWREQLP